MADWNMYELEDNMWDLFSENSDHIVPRYSVQQTNLFKECDSRKKARHDLQTFAERTKSSKTVEFKIQRNNEDIFSSLPTNVNTTIPGHLSSDAINKVICTTADNGCINGITETSCDSKAPTNVLDAQNLVVNGNGFCSIEPTCGDTSMDESSFNCFPYNTSAATIDLDFLENEEKDVKNVLDSMWFDSPDIDSLEKFEELPRNSYTLNRHEIGGCMDEQLWFSSLSKKADFNAVGVSSENNEASKLIWPEKSEPLICDADSSSLVYRSFSQWLDADGADTANIVDYTAMDDFEDPRQNLEGQSERFSSSQATTYVNEKHIYPEASASQTSFFHFPESQTFASEANFLDSGHVKMNYHHYPQQFPATHSTASTKPEEDRFLPNPHVLSAGQGIGQAHYAEQSHSRVDSAPSTKICASQSVFTNQLNLENRVGVASEMQEMSKKQQENVLLSSINLQELQNAMDQLDIRTTLCLRDGLYRLAKSAEHRHDDVQNKEPTHASSSPERDELKRSEEFAQAETGTNAIDRSIAYLLFHGDSITCTM